MRRSSLVLVGFTLAGCSALRDVFSAHPQVAGSAAGQTLTVERLAQLAGRAKKVPLRPEALTGLTDLAGRRTVGKVVVRVGGGQNS